MSSSFFIICCFQVLPLRSPPQEPFHSICRDSSKPPFPTLTRTVSFYAYIFSSASIMMDIEVLLKKNRFHHSNHSNCNHYRMFQATARSTEMSSLPSRSFGMSQRIRPAWDSTSSPTYVYHSINQSKLLLNSCWETPDSRR